MAASPHPDRLCAAALGALVLARSAGALWRVFGSDDAGLATSIPDDVYYYVVPAYRATRDGFFTFDGVHPTFGFQPLWALLLAAVGAAFDTRIGALRADLLLAAALQAATAVVLATTSERMVNGVGARVGPTGLFAATLYFGNLAYTRASGSGMENALYGLLLAAALATVQTRSVIVGLLPALLPFARLTPASVLVSLVLALYAARHTRGAVGVYVVAAAAGVVANVTLFGHLLPVSGLIKLAGWTEGLAPTLLVSMANYPLQQLRFGLGLPSAFGHVGAGFLVSLPALALAVGLAVRDRARPHPLLAALLLAALAGAMAIPMLLHHRGGEIYYYAWYVVEFPVLLPVLLAQLAGRLRRALALAAAVAALPSVGLATPPITGLAHAGPWQRTMWESAAFLDTLQLAEGEYIGAFNAGLLGFRSRTPVVNLDGLANDDILSLDVPLYDYVRRENIVYISDVMWGEGWFGAPTEGVEIVREFPFDVPPFSAYYVARVVDIVEP